MPGLDAAVVTAISRIVWGWHPRRMTRASHRSATRQRRSDGSSQRFVAEATLASRASGAGRRRVHRGRQGPVATECPRAGPGSITGSRAAGASALHRYVRPVARAHHDGPPRAGRRGRSVGSGSPGRARWPSPARRTPRRRRSNEPACPGGAPDRALPRRAVRPRTASANGERRRQPGWSNGRRALEHPTSDAPAATWLPRWRRSGEAMRPSLARVRGPPTPTSRYPGPRRRRRQRRRRCRGMSRVGRRLATRPPPPDARGSSRAGASRCRTTPSPGTACFPPWLCPVSR